MIGDGFALFEIRCESTGIRWYEGAYLTTKWGQVTTIRGLSGIMLLKYLLQLLR
jgi:hypothetical protein